MWPTKRKSRPTSAEAARRLIILKHVVASAFVRLPREALQEIMAQCSDEDKEQFRRQAVADRDQFCQHLRDARLWQSMSPLEQAFARSTMLTVTEQQQVNATWRLEAVQTLMWAFGLLVELPPYDTSADPDLLEQVPSADDAGFIESARLRDEQELDKARDTAEFWHWRSRTRELINRGQPFPADEKMKAAGFRSYDDIVRFSARESAQDGTIPACIDDDFPAMGKAYRDLSEEEWCGVRSITMERHFTFNWLCGYAPGNRWDDTPTDT